MPPAKNPGCHSHFAFEGDAEIRSVGKARQTGNDIQVVGGLHEQRLGPVDLNAQNLCVRRIVWRSIASIPMLSRRRQVFINLRPGEHIESIPTTIGYLDDDGTLQTSAAKQIDCDGIVMSVGWTPNGSPYYQAGGRFHYAKHVEQFVPDGAQAGLFAAGRLNGLFSWKDRLADGRRAGPDAATFLERIYTGRFLKQTIGQLRYGLACDETGVIIDDGLVARLADNRFYVTATSILQEVVAKTAACRIWIDPTYAEYLWKVLEEICGDLGGRVIGAGCLMPSAGRTSTLR